MHAIPLPSLTVNPGFILVGIDGHGHGLAISLRQVSGFVEMKNQIIKFTGVGPKTSAKQLYDMLNERTELD